MQFKEWLLLEVGKKAQMEVDPSVQPQPLIYAGSKVYQMGSPEELGQIALKGLKKFFTDIDPRGFRYAKERYHFRLTKVHNDYDGLKMTIEIIPLEKHPGQEELADPSKPLYSYYQKYQQGKTGWKVYKTPKDAIEDIPPDPNLAYRGISWEEWQDIQKTGFIQSRGQWNIGQEGYTLLGKIPRTALNYATSFAPIQYTISFRKPGVVIAVPRHLTLTHKDDPKNIPDSELGIKGKLSKHHIQAAWMITPRTMKPGEIELIFPYVPAWSEEKWRDPMTGFFKIDSNSPRSGSGILNIIGGYNIRKMF